MSKYKWQEFEDGVVYSDDGHAVIGIRHSRLEWGEVDDDWRVGFRSSEGVVRVTMPASLTLDEVKQAAITLRGAQT